VIWANPIIPKTVNIAFLSYEPKYYFMLKIKNALEFIIP